MTSETEAQEHLDKNCQVQDLSFKAFRACNHQAKHELEAHVGKKIQSSQSSPEQLLKATGEGRERLFVCSYFKSVHFKSSSTK